MLVICFLLFYRAGKPPTGMHLDVAKNDKLVEVSPYYLSVLLADVFTA